MKTLSALIIASSILVFPSVAFSQQQVKVLNPNLLPKVKKQFPPIAVLAANRRNDYSASRNVCFVKNKIYKCEYKYINVLPSAVKIRPFPSTLYCTDINYCIRWNLKVPLFEFKGNVPPR